MSLLVVRAGMFTTVQDLGRWGYQDRGVPVAGAMDAFSHRAANRLVGNPDEAATLEITLAGPVVAFETPAAFAVAGAEFDLQLERGSGASEIATGVRGEARPGDTLTFGARRRGARSYLAVAGGFDVTPWLGSRATDVRSRMGGVEGRPVRSGDRLAVGASRAAPGPRLGPPVAARLPEGRATLRVMWGPDEERLGPAALEVLTRTPYVVTPASDRMGYRLSGDPVPLERGADLLSDATPAGTVQVPGSGQPILLMADRQTAGGYVRAATVVSADLPLAGQLAPGDAIRFRPCGRDEALAALRALEHALDAIGKG